MNKSIRVAGGLLLILMLSAGCGNNGKKDLSQDMNDKKLSHRNLIKTGNGYLTSENIPYQSKSGKVKKNQTELQEDITYDNPDMNTENNSGMNETVPPTQPPSGTEGQGFDQQRMEQVVELTNQERRKNGLPDLKWDPSLSKMAQVKANDMEQNNYFSHDSPTHGSPFDQMEKMDIDYSAAGENIAVGQDSPQQVVNDWMNSEGHRKNILNPEYTHIGIGFTDNEDFWAQEFIKK